MDRLNSGNFRIFEPSESNLNLNSSDCSASKIVHNDTKLELISWELNLKNLTLNFLFFAWAFEQVGVIFSKRKKNNFKEPGFCKIVTEIIFEDSKQYSQNNYVPHRAARGENTNERNSNKRHWRAYIFYEDCLQDNNRYGKDRLRNLQPINYWTHR